jgi:predicted SAM-dependent methyltransferase
MRKIQFGCGGNILPGWENYDYDVDITKTLPFSDDSVDAILTEHVVEHVTIHQAWDFFEECMRILKRGGFLRVAVPSVSRIHALADQDYFNFIKEQGWGEPNIKGAVKSIIFNHEHKTIWEQASLNAIMDSMGFQVLSDANIIMVGTLNHGRVIGQKMNDIDTIVVDCMKP